MNNRLPAYNLKDGEEIKAEGPINGGMQSPNSPSDAEAEGEASGRESEPEAESEQTGCCILTDEIIPQTDADRETAAGITAQRLIQDEEYDLTRAADEAERQQGATNDDSAEMWATLCEDRRQTAMEEHRTFTARIAARERRATRNASREVKDEADQTESGEGEGQANQPSPDTARRTAREAAEARISGENNRQTNGMTTPSENQVSSGAVEEEEDASPSPPNSNEGDARYQATENARQEGITVVMQQLR